MEDCLIGLPPTITTVSHAPDIFDEFNCLNLNITTPAEAKSGDDLPVLVYVHGGGGFSGSNSDWWCDGGAIVKRSVEIGKPVVMVAIKYVFLAMWKDMGMRILRLMWKQLPIGSIWIHGLLRARRSQREK